jgi:hypothetical protein
MHCLVVRRWLPHPTSTYACSINWCHELRGAQPIQYAAHASRVWATDEYADFQILTQSRAGDIRAANQRDVRVSQQHFGVNADGRLAGLCSGRGIALEWHRSAGQLVAQERDCLGVGTLGIVQFMGDDRDGDLSKCGRPEGLQQIADANPIEVWRAEDERRHDLKELAFALIREEFIHKAEDTTSAVGSTPAPFNPLGTGVLVFFLGAGLSFIFGPVGLLLMLCGVIFVVWGALITWLKG